MSCNALKVGRRNVCTLKKLKTAPIEDKMRGIALDGLDMYNRDQRMKVKVKGQKTTDTGQNDWQLRNILKNESS